MGNLLAPSHPNQRQEDKKYCVYKIPCAQCNKVYIGETKRKIITRIKEHQNACKRAVQNGMVHSKGENDMGLPLHHLREGHSFDFERFEIIYMHMQ